MNNFSEFIFQLIVALASIPFNIKEAIRPSQSKPKDFLPIGRSLHNDGCFYLRFPCRRFQKQRTQMVIEFWKKTCYVDNGDEFVFVEAGYDDSWWWSCLTIRFRARVTTTSITYNFYNSNVCFNTQINEYQLAQIDKLEQLIHAFQALDDTEREEYINTLGCIKRGEKPSETKINKLWKFVVKQSELIGTVADIAGIIGFIIELLI